MSEQSNPAAESTQALAPRVPSSGALITSPEQFTEKLRAWSGHYNVMSPFTNLTALAPQHAIIASQVLIDPNPAKGGPGDVYDGLPFLKTGEVALAKLGLRKIAECAGISIEPTRTDPRTIQFYWEVKARATYRGVDGSLVSRTATVEWDLRDGSPRLKGWDAKQINEARKHGLRACETRAINAVIRECGCGLKQAYHRDELKKPFLMLRVSFQPDMADPEVRRLVTQSHLQGTAALYAGSSSPALEAEAVLDDAPLEPIEPRRVGGSASLPPATTVEVPASDEPPVAGAVRIVDVIKVKSGTGRNGAWTLWKVIDSNGVEYSTLEPEVEAAAQKVKADHAWVTCITETRGEYTNLVELAVAGSRLPFDEEKL